MGRRIRSMSVLLLSAVMLTGCWDLKSIQDLNYVTALGFDYEDGQYVVYAQLLDFSTVAKTERGKSSEPIPVWVGKGKGETPVEAINDLYLTSQQRLFYGQVNALIITEKVMKHGLDKVADLPRRYYELRYTPWVFGSKLPVGELFAVNPFFNLSPLVSILHLPNESYKQESLVAPLTLREFITSYTEPGKSTLLPSLSISDRSWKNGPTPSPKIEINGLFAYQEKRYCGWLGVKQVRGLRWVEPKTRRSPLLLESQGEKIATVSLEAPDIRLTPLTREGRVRFKVRVKLAGYIVESFEHRSQKEMEQMAEDLVRGEIEQTYARGLKNKVDLLQLEHALYRKRNREWKRWKQDGEWLAPDSLAEVEVKVRLQHAGKLKS